ncbi:hypothetical protein F5B20DRAFT_589034 [Whalleya microplaca]|nr:hypothetical protein F5B20DRAFT_589034 [Whalleya microplaca]
MATNPASALRGDLEQGRAGCGNIYKTAYVRDVTLKVIPFCAAFLVIFSIGAILVSTFAFGRPIPQQGTLVISILLAVLFFFFCIGCVYLYHEKHYPPMPKGPIIPERVSSRKCTTKKWAKRASTLVRSNTQKNTCTCGRDQRGHELESHGPAELENPEQTSIRFSNGPLGPGHPSHTGGQHHNHHQQQNQREHSNPCASTRPNRNSGTSNAPSRHQVHSEGELGPMSWRTSHPTFSQPVIPEVDEHGSPVQIPVASSQFQGQASESNLPHPSSTGRYSAGNPDPGTSVDNAHPSRQTSRQDPHVDQHPGNPRSATAPVSELGGPSHQNKPQTKANTSRGEHKHEAGSLIPDPLNIKKPTNLWPNPPTTQWPANSKQYYTKNGGVVNELGPAKRVPGSELDAANLGGQYDSCERQPREAPTSPDRASVPPASEAPTSPTQGHKLPEHMRIRVSPSPSPAPSLRKPAAKGHHSAPPRFSVPHKVQDRGCGEAERKRKEIAGMNRPPPSRAPVQQTADREANGRGDRNSRSKLSTRSTQQADGAKPPDGDPAPDPKRDVQHGAAESISDLPSQAKHPHKAAEAPHPQRESIRSLKARWTQELRHPMYAEAHLQGLDASRLRPETPEAGDSPPRVPGTPLPPEELWDDGTRYGLPPVESCEKVGRDVGLRGSALWKSLADIPLRISGMEWRTRSATGEGLVRENETNAYTEKVLRWI